MKIAIFVDIFPKLSETFILNQITGLLDRGYIVDIIARNRNNEDKMHADVIKYKLLDRTQYIDIPRNRFIRVVSGIWIIVKYFVKCKQVFLRWLDKYKYPEYALSFYTLHMLAPFLKNYDIIHCHFGPIGNSGAILKILGIRSKLVTTFHGYDIRLGIEKGGNIYKNISDYADCIISISDYNYNNLVGFGFDKNKIVNLPVGIDLSKYPFTYRTNSNSYNNTITILTVARLVMEKGLKDGIEAIYKLVQKRPELIVRYNIIGDGPLLEELKYLTNKFMLNKMVYFLGPLENEVIIQYLQESDIYFLPSIAEALPVSLMEAEATGLPVVATKVGSVNQIVLDAETGFIVPANDVNSMADRLEYLIDHPEICSIMGHRGRKHIEEHFDVNKLNDRLVEIYKNLLS